MLLERLEELDEAKLQKLCEERCPESGTLDFKLNLPGTSDKDKHEFLKDVCSFANAEGGDLVYGIGEDDGVAKILSPIAGEAADSAKRRLGQVLDAGLEPRLQGISFQEVKVTNGYVLVVRVPASFDGPHRYLFNNHSKFVMRNGTHTSELTYDQLRLAFDRTATLADKARRFRDDRLQAIINRKTWRPMKNGPICAVHLIPIASMSGRKTVDVQSLYHDYTRFMFPDWGGASRTLNLDGLVVHPGLSDDSGATAFNQIFRTGAMEALRHGGLLTNPDRQFIPSSTVSAFFRDAITRFIRAAQSFGFSGPAVVSASLLFVGDYEFGLGQQYLRSSRALADRQHLILPEAWVDSIETVTDFEAVVRPILDVLWQAFDVESCELYDDQGVWSPRR